MNISQVARQIDVSALGTDISNLQELRKGLKRLRRRTGRRIFENASISDEDEYAFHYGGRNELQFNIGFEGGFLRYGLAFSFERSRSFLDIGVLKDSLISYNSFVTQNQRYFDGFLMWHYAPDKSDEYYPTIIADELFSLGNFIFIGKKQNSSSINYNEIVNTFNYLLTLYKFVENRQSFDSEEINANGGRIQSGLQFVPGHRPSARNATAHIPERVVDIDRRHSLIQDKLYEKLERLYGHDNVETETGINGKKIDAVAKYDGNTIFYEIKTEPNARACIRQAIGQLLEYCYYQSPDNNGFAEKLIVVGEAALDEETTNYLDILNKKHVINISYEQIAV